MKDLNLWEETINPETGKSSISTHTPKVVQTWCAPADHNFFFEGGASREATCLICKYTTSYVPGYHSIVNGKIITP